MATKKKVVNSEKPSKFSRLRASNLNFETLASYKQSKEVLLEVTDRLLNLAVSSGSERSIAFYNGEVKSLRESLIRIAEFERRSLIDAINLSGFTLTEYENDVITTQIFDESARNVFEQTFNV